MPEGDRGLPGIPSDIYRFFDTESGRTLFVKGRPKTGKTRFTLQLAEEIGEAATTFYISTRGPADPFIPIFPWLKENESRDALLRTRRPAPAAPAAPAGPAAGAHAGPRSAKDILGALRGSGPLPEAAPAKPKSARDLLKSILDDSGGQQGGPGAAEGTPLAAGGEASGTKIPRDGMEKLFSAKLPMELVAAYNGIERALPKPTILIINRADRFAEQYGVDFAQMVKVLERDLVETARTRLVMVLDRFDTKLDYLGQAILTIKEFNRTDEYIGQVELTKLTGMDIRQNRFMFSVKGGRISFLKGISIGV